jgi:hypothetical protein
MISSLQRVPDQILLLVLPIYYINCSLSRKLSRSHPNLVTFSSSNFIHKVSLQAANLNCLVDGKGWFHYREYVRCNVQQVIASVPYLRTGTLHTVHTLSWNDAGGAASYEFANMLTAIQTYRATHLPLVTPIMISLAKQDLVFKFHLSSLGEGNYGYMCYPVSKREASTCVT